MTSQELLDFLNKVDLRGITEELYDLFYEMGMSLDDKNNASKVVPLTRAITGLIKDVAIDSYENWEFIELNGIFKE